MTPWLEVKLTDEGLIWMLFWIAIGGAAVALIIGTTSASINREMVRAESCYVEYGFNQNTQQSYVKVDYCGGQENPDE